MTRSARRRITSARGIEYHERLFWIIAGLFVAVALGNFYAE
ncbi:hypothetical protein [Arthrobacter sp. 131MFCol6.1]|nr:hypothetical protein [Arthrobacter sp. 131MFCol6.1]